VSEPAAFTETEWPVMRNLVETVLHQHRPHTVYGVAEADVTESLAALAALQRKARIAIPFNAFAIHCLARGATEFPETLTYRRGKRLVTFRDANVGTLIEKQFPGGIRLPASHTVRAAQTKSLAEITFELRHAIRTDQSHIEAVKLRRRLAKMPALVRRYTAWRMGRDPFMLNRYHGNIGMTTLQSPGFRTALVALPPNISTTTVALGTIAPRLKLDKSGQVTERKVLSIGAGFDHLIIDGMSISRFSHRVVQLLESTDAITDSFIDEMRVLTARGVA
jgi:pyruvate/2-oxoglutarate dehydrogenase complex dihydrolipoamide acyltransferase (E2) component